MTKPARGRPRREGADQEILAAALALLRERGYREFSIDDVVARTGIAKTTIYRRWPSKGALVASATAPIAATTVTAADTGSVVGDVAAVLREFCSILTGELGPIAAALIGESHADPELQKIVRTAVEPRRILLREAIARGVARGEVASDADVEMLVDILTGAIWTRLLITGGAIDERLAEGIARQVLGA